MRSILHECKYFKLGQWIYADRPKIGVHHHDSVIFFHFNILFFYKKREVMHWKRQSMIRLRLDRIIGYNSRYTFFLAYHFSWCSWFLSTKEFKFSKTFVTNTSVHELRTPWIYDNIYANEKKYVHGICLSQLESEFSGLAKARLFRGMDYD